VLFAALVALKHSRKTEYKNWCKNYRPLRKVRFLIFFATVLGITELYCGHHFHKQMKQMHKFGREHDQPEQHDVAFLNEDEHRGRHLRRHDDDHHEGGDRQIGGDRHDDDHHKGGDHHKGKDHHKGGKGKHGRGHHGKFKAFFAVAMWLVLVSPLMCMMRQFTWLKFRINKINSKCTEAQRVEVSRRIVQNMQQACSEAPAVEAKPCKSSDKLAAKAAKLKAKLQKITEKMQKKQP